MIKVFITIDVETSIGGVIDCFFMNKEDLKEFVRVKRSRNYP